MNSFSQGIRWTTRAAPHVPARSDYRLLVVDDDRPGAEALTAALSLAGYDAQYVLDGPMALQTVWTRMPDIVLMDVDMPGMNGLDVARLLRSDARTQHLVIVAFTAQDDSSVRSGARAGDFDAYCQKGGAPGSLLRLLEELT